MNIINKATKLTVGLSLAMSVPAVGAYAQTPDEIRERGEINIGVPVDFPPFGIIGESGEPVGYDVDVANLIAEELGVDANLVAASGQNRIPYLISDRVDLIVASLGITPERAARVDYSQPYAGIEIAVYGREELDISDASDLDGVRIGVVLGATQDSAVTDIAPEGATIQRFDDNAMTNQALLSGQVDAIGASNTVIAHLNEVAPGQFDMKFPLSQQLQGIAVEPGSDELLSFVNDVLTEIKADGRLNAIHEEWLDSPLPQFLADSDEGTTAELSRPTESD